MKEHGVSNTFKIVGNAHEPLQLSIVPCLYLLEWGSKPKLSLPEHNLNLDFSQVIMQVL